MCSKTSFVTGREIEKFMCVLKTLTVQIAIEVPDSTKYRCSSQNTKPVGIKTNPWESSHTVHAVSG